MRRHILARTIIFSVAIFSLFYSIFIATISFKGLNITAFHLSRPLLIGYGVFWLIVAPSGLWGIFGSIQNNAELCNRYLKDNRFSSALITLIDVIKIVLSFTMKDNSMQQCLAQMDSSQDPETAISSCRRKIDFNQKSGLVVFGVQEFILFGFGVLIWFSCKRLTPKKDSKLKVPSENDLEVQSPRGLNDSNRDLIEQRQNTSLERIENNQYPSSEYNKEQEQDRQQKIKKNKNGPKRSRENSKDVQRSGQQYTRPRSKSQPNDRRMTSSDGPQIQRQGPPPQGMNPMDSKSTKMAPPIARARSRSTMLPPPLPEYRTIPIQYSQGMQMVPFPPHYNRPPLPQFQPNFQPPYPLQQQWNDGPQRASIRGHRRSKSHPQLRPLPVPPGSDTSTVPSIPPQIPKQQQPIPPQIIERQKQAMPPRQQQAIPPQRQQTIPPQRQQQTIPPQRQQQTIPPQRQQAIPSQRQQETIPPQITERQQVPESKNKNDNSSSTNLSSRYKPPVFEQNRPLSNIHRANSLPNLYNHEYLMRHEMLMAPPVPMIPPSLQPGMNNSNKSNSKNSQKPKQQQPPPITNNEDKLEKFIKMYGNKDYMAVPETLPYNKYSVAQYENNDYGRNIYGNYNYIPPARPRPKSAHSVRGEARPKSSASSEDEDRYYNDDYYYEQPSGYRMNQETMNIRNNNNYAYTQYAGPMYNNGGNFVQNPMGYNGGWGNYGQQRTQGAQGAMMYYYY